MARSVMYNEKAYRNLCNMYGRYRRNLLNSDLGSLLQSRYGIPHMTRTIFCTYDIGRK